MPEHLFHSTSHNSNPKTCQHPLACLLESSVRSAARCPRTVWRNYTLKATAGNRHTRFHFLKARQFRCLLRCLL